MPVAWVVRHQGLGGTDAFPSQKEALEQYLRCLGGRPSRTDLFRVSHEGSLGAFDVRQRVEHAVFGLPADVPAGLTVSAGPGTVVQHVLGSEG